MLFCLAAKILNKFFRQSYYFAMSKSFSLITFVTSILFFCLLEAPARAENKVTNEIDVTANLIMPSSKNSRGETLFELKMSDAHFERAQGSCASGRWGGATAFKVTGKDEEWEESLQTSDYQESPNGRILYQESNGQYISMNSDIGLKIGGINTAIRSNGYAKKAIFSFKTNGWKGGEYTLIGFVSDGCREFSMVTAKMLLPEIPKPELTCSAPKTTYVGDKFEVVCSSTLELSASVGAVQLKGDEGWQEVSSLIATGRNFTVPDVETSEVGTIEIRVVLGGIADQLQDSTSNLFYIQSNPQKLNIKSTLTITKASENGLTSITMNSGNTVLDATLQGSQSPNGPWTDIAQIRSNTTVSKDLEFGTWVRIQYEGNTAVKPGLSDPYQVLITPKFSCSFPKKIAAGRIFEISCNANQNLQATPINLQYLDSSDDWSNVSSGTATGSEVKFSFSLEGRGKQKFRIRADGLENYYTAFVSNVASVEFINPPSSTSKSSQSKSNSAPKGKVDKNSNAYKLMRTFGRNVAANSLATDSAKSQCLSAKNTGLVKVRGIPRYLGTQAIQIQSYLKTASGFQGCLDGFGK